MRYCFYSGYKQLFGGYTTLVITLITALRLQGEKVVLINFKNGLIEKELLKKNIYIEILDLEELGWEEISKKIYPTDLFIITRFVEPFRHLMKVNPRVIYYDINDFIGEISAYKFGINFRRLGKILVQRLLDNNSLVWMDDTGIFNIKNHFDIDVEGPVFLPIPVNTAFSNEYINNPVVIGDCVRLTYIGRSVNWKMMPLRKILSDLAAINKKIPVHFTVVVDDASEVEKFVPVGAYNATAGLSVEVIENLLPSEIPSFLKTAHLHFAMGTAALDAAKIGVPTVLVDYSSREFPRQYQYKWLYQTKGFSLGRNLLKMPADAGQPLDDILNDLIMNESSRINHSTLSYNYVADHHNAEKIVKKLIIQASIARFRMRDAERLVPFYFKLHGFLKKMGRLLHLKYS
jgi:hypothetical protein